MEWRKIEFLHKDIESSEKLAELEIKELAFCFDGIKCINPLCLNKCNPIFSSKVDMSGYEHTQEYKDYMKEINSKDKIHFMGNIIPKKQNKELKMELFKRK